MRISRTAGWSLATAALCVALLVACWLLLISPQRADAAEDRAATEQVARDNEVLEQSIEQLQVDYATLPQRREELAAIRSALPAAAGLQALLDEVDAAAVAAPVTLDSVTNGEAVPLIEAPAEDAAAPVEDATAEAGLRVVAPAPTPPVPAPDAQVPAEPVPGATAPAPSAPAEAAPAPAVPADSVGAPAAAAEAPGDPLLAAIPVSINATGDYFAVAAFVKALQADIDRALLMDSVSFDLVTAAAASSPAGGEPVAAPESAQVTVSVTGRVFAYVDPQADLAAGPATPTGELP